MYMTVHLHSMIHNNQGHVILKMFYFKIVITTGYFPNYW